MQTGLKEHLCCVYFFSPAYELYLNLSIAPKKLVMGLPWYGYDYPCLNVSEVSCPACLSA